MSMWVFERLREEALGDVDELSNELNMVQDEAAEAAMR
jgi:hypothetical protein